ncbi:transposable element Tcb2 transposase [Trichonephila clavipes]|nr:transposable element Tcb2 transposase [Trichonephila clavipes]
MEWPACSPDMNPIEHVWDALGRRVAGRQPPPQTLQEQERALLEEWDRIPQLVINSLIDSMPQRCLTLLAVRGNHTPTEENTVGVLMPMKTHRVERMMHLGTGKVQSPYVGIAWKFEDWNVSSDADLVT